MSDESDEITVLDFVEMVCSVKCEGHCRQVKSEDGVNSHEYTAMLITQGWRVTRGGNLICPKCKGVKAQ